MVEELTAVKLQSLIQNKEIVFADFSAVWCGPCRELGKIIDREIMPKIAKDENIAFVKIDIDCDENREFVHELAIDGVPAVFVWFKGEPVVFSDNVSDPRSKKRSKNSKKRAKETPCLEGFRPDFGAVVDWVIAQLRTPPESAP